MRYPALAQVVVSRRVRSLSLIGVPVARLPLIGSLVAWVVSIVFRPVSLPGASGGCWAPKPAIHGVGASPSVFSWAIKLSLWGAPAPGVAIMLVKMVAGRPKTAPVIGNDMPVPPLKTTEEKVWIEGKACPPVKGGACVVAPGCIPVKGISVGPPPVAIDSQWLVVR